MATRGAAGLSGYGSLSVPSRVAADRPGRLLVRQPPCHYYRGCGVDSDRMNGS